MGRKPSTTTRKEIEKKTRAKIKVHTTTLSQNRRSVKRILLTSLENDIVINDLEVERLASYDCTIDEIAAVMRVDRDKIYEEFKEAFLRGRKQGNYSLKFKAFEKAMMGDNQMLIFLLKQRGMNEEGVRYNERPEGLTLQGNTINVLIAEIPK